MSQASNISQEEQDKITKQIHDDQENIRHNQEELDNYKAFDTVDNHIFLREGTEDDCQVCGFPERFHNYRYLVLTIKKRINELNDVLANMEDETEWKNECTIARDSLQKILDVK